MIKLQSSCLDKAMDLSYSIPKAIHVILQTGQVNEITLQCVVPVYTANFVYNEYG